MPVRTLAALVVSAIVPFLSLSTAAAQTADPRSCISGLNKAGAKAASAAQSDASYCAKLTYRFDLPVGMSPQACLSADLRGKVGKASTHVSTVDAAHCAPPPSFGYAGAATVSAAGRMLALDLVADLFGTDVGAGVFGFPCQTRLLRNVAKLTDAQLDEFRRCKKAGLTDGTIVDAASLAGCLAAITTDPTGKVGDALARLADDDARCNLSSHDQLFPGRCVFSNDFLSCVDVRARCRVCEALNRMDALAMDCEAFDDGLANGSCGPCIPDPDGVCCNASDKDVCGVCGGTGFRCGWTQISVAPTHACGLKSGGSIACWGHNYAGELAPPSGTFTQVVSGGSSSEVNNSGHSCALHPDQTAVCWGRNDYGQATAPSGTFLQLSAGSYHSCGLRPGGSIECWGLNDRGQTTAPAGTFTRISAAGRSNCALRSDGEVACWGDNFYGNLTPPAGPFIDVEAADIHSYGLRPDQTAVDWGEALPQFVPASGPFVEIQAAQVNGCGRRADGSLECWPAPPSEVAVTPPPGTFVQMDAGQRIYCAVRNDTMLFCWGDIYTQSGAPPK